MASFSIAFWYGIIYLLTSQELSIVCRVFKIGHDQVGAFHLNKLVITTLTHQLVESLDSQLVGG